MCNSVSVLSPLLLVTATFSRSSCRQKNIKFATRQDATNHLPPSKSTDLVSEGASNVSLKKNGHSLGWPEKRNSCAAARLRIPFNSTMKRASANYQFDYKNREGPTHVPVTVTSGHPKFSHSQPATRAPNNNRRWEKWFPPTNHNKTKVETLGGL